MESVIERKNLLLSIIIVLVLVFGVTGCMETRGGRTAAGAGAGTVIGGLLGWGLGAAAGSPELGAALGAGLGAGIGAGIGYSMGDDDTEKMKRLSGLIMSADELNKNLAFIGVSPEAKNAIMVDVNTIVRSAPDATFTVNMHGQVQRYS